MAKQNLGNRKKLKTSAKISRKMVSQRFWALLGYIATSIGIAVVIFQFGQQYGSASAKQQEFRHFVEYLEKLKSGIRITSLSCLNNQISAG